MKTLRLFLLVACALVAINVQAQWNLVWSDEFTSGISGDWVFETGTGSGGWGNNELEYYRRENATVSNGQLVITARREAFGGMQYTSARMKTQGRRSWRYGKIEARIAMPSFQGVWPAFWMLGDNIGSVGWPKCGEIDIMEHVNTGGAVYGTIHWDNNGYVSYGGNTTTSITSFHNYTIEWDASAIRWYVDGVKYHEANIANSINGTNEFHANFFILLNLAIGGNWPGFTVDNNAFPANMYVDYVRVYQAGSTPPPPPPTSSAPIGRTIAIRGNNNLFVSGNNGTAPLICNRTTAQAWEQFTVVDAGGGKIALRSMGKYVSSENGTAAMTANRTTIGDWEKFDWVVSGSGFALRGNNGRYVSSENGAANMMCNRTTIGGWEVFSYTIAAREATSPLQEETQLDDSALDVFPNPSANGSVTINVARPSNVTIVDMKGKPVVSEFVEKSLTVNNMTSGLYIVNRRDKQSKSVKKLVIR